MSHSLHRADASETPNGIATSDAVSIANGHANGAASGALSKTGFKTQNEDSGFYSPDFYEEGWNFARFKALLGRRKWVMAGVFSTILGLAALIGLLTPRIYRSTAQVIINTSQNQSNSIASDNPALQNLLQGAGGRSQSTEIELLQSRPVQVAARQILPDGLQKTPIARLEVKPIGTTDLVEVSTSSINPEFSQKFSNALCSAYVQQAQDESTRKYKTSASYVRGQLVTLKSEMDAANEALRRYKEANGITDLTVEGGARVARLKELQTSLEVARVEKAAGESQLANLRAQVASTPRAEIAPNTIVVRPELQQLRQQLVQLSSERTQLLEEYTPQSPEVRGLDGRIKSLRAQIAGEPRTEVGTYTRNINPLRQQLEQQVSETSAAIGANASRIASLGPQIEAARRELAAIPGRESQVGKLQLALETYREAFKTLNDRYVTLSINQSAPVANARLYAEADSSAQTKPNLKINLLSGLFLGLIAALGAALLADKMDDRIHSEDEVRSATGLPILASIPKIARFEDQSLVSNLGAPNGQTTTPLLESYRMLRTGLMFTVLDSASRSIVLTSSQPNEGKSSVAANLAAVLALNGKTVLLIDADLRRPSAHRLFGLNGEQGFSSVAAGFCSLDEAIQDTNIAGLRVLVGGQTPPNPPEMLDSKAGRAIFQAARSMADFVIIDAPPALMMADAQIIATEADGVLLVVSWEEALKNSVARATDMMARTGIKLLGVVVNKWDDRSVDYGHYYQKDVPALPEATRKK